LQILGIVGSVSSLLFNSYMPEIASLKLNNTAYRYLQIFSRAIAVQWIVSIIGILFIVILGPIVLNFIGANTTLLPSFLLVILGSVFFLEWNHSTFATLITMSNTVPFVGASVFSGIGIVTTSVIVLEFTNLGILGIVLSQGIVQLAYNNWRWPLWVLRENKISIYTIVKYSFIDLKEYLDKRRKRYNNER
jgi:hypothetical protein